MRCDTCVIMRYVEMSDDPAHCVWYMDNVINGDKTPESCPYYYKVQDTQEEE